jgi:hypothetical protein
MEESEHLWQRSQSPRKTRHQYPEHTFGVPLLQRVAGDAVLFAVGVVLLVIAVASVLAGVVGALLLARVDGGLTHDTWIGDSCLDADKRLDEEVVALTLGSLDISDLRTSSAACNRWHHDTMASAWVLNTFCSPLLAACK